MLRVFRPVLLILLVLGLFFVIAQKIVEASDYANSDFFSFWLAGRMLLTGENPYSATAWIEGHREFNASWISDQTFLYPLTLAVFFIPLGVLRLKQAYVLWLFLSQSTILAVLYTLFFRLWRSPKVVHFIFPVLSAVVLFRPVWITLRNGQLGAWFLGLLTLIVYFWERKNWVMGSIFLPFLVLKPQLGIPILIFLGIWLLAHRHYASILAILGTTLLLFGAGWLVQPGWVNEFIAISANKSFQVFGYQPNLWGVSNYVCSFQPSCATILGIGGGIFFTLMTLSILLRQDVFPAFVIGLVTTTALILTPYTWVYDQILLILPLSLLTIYFSNAGYSYLVSALTFLFPSIAALALIFVAMLLGLDIWSVTIPILIFGLLGWLYAKTPSVQLTAPDTPLHSPQTRQLREILGRVGIFR